MALKIEAGDWDMVVDAVDDLLRGLRGGTISQDDARGHILTLIDSAALDSVNFAKIASGIARYAKERAEAYSR